MGLQTQRHLRRGIGFGVARDIGIETRLDTSGVGRERVHGPSARRAQHRAIGEIDRAESGSIAEPEQALAQVSLDAGDVDERFGGERTVDHQRCVSVVVPDLATNDKRQRAAFGIDADGVRAGQDHRSAGRQSDQRVELDDRAGTHEPQVACTGIHEHFDDAGAGQMGEVDARHRRPVRIQAQQRVRGRDEHGVGAGYTDRQRGTVDRPLADPRSTAVEIDERGADSEPCPTFAIGGDRPQHRHDIERHGHGHLCHERIIHQHQGRVGDHPRAAVPDRRHVADGRVERRRNPRARCRVDPRQAPCFDQPEALRARQRRECEQEHDKEPTRSATRH